MVEFYLRIYFDVLLELLRFGCRRRFNKLERVSRRFHWLIEKWFPDAPFLRLNLEFIPATGYSFFLPINFNQSNKQTILLHSYTITISVAWPKSQIRLIAEWRSGAHKTAPSPIPKSCRHFEILSYRLSQ